MIFEQAAKSLTPYVFGRSIPRFSAKPGFWAPFPFVCNCGLAEDIVGGSLLEITRRPPGEGAIAALAIFPDFAPALLTVGSMEYQYDRADEAMRYFLRLTTLSADTMDLVEIIDRAGSFLTDVPDLSRAERL